MVVVNSGQVRIYKWNGTVGHNVVVYYGISGYDESGYSVALSSDGTIVAIGPLSINNFRSGKNFKWNGTSWSQRGSSIDGAAADDESGSSVALSSDGTIVAIGATYIMVVVQNSGQVRILNGMGAVGHNVVVILTDQRLNDREWQVCSIKQ